MKLKRFEKKSIKKKVVFSLLGVFAVTLSLLVGRTYALYQHEDEVQFINAKVRFPKANEISYTNTSKSNVTNVEEALNDLYEKVGE